MTGASEDRTEREIGRLSSALGDPTRRRVFFAVRAAGGAQSKDEVAAAVGIERRLAAFHLDKLVAEGFLEADFARPAGRAGPGAGRPAKRYRLAAGELTISLPERRYELLATLLLRASREEGGGSAQEALERVGFHFGFEAGLAELTGAEAAPLEATAGARDRLASALSRYGFDARPEGKTGVRACSCPFEGLAFDDPERICGLDRAIWSGMMAALAPDATLGPSTTRARGDEACVAEVEDVTPV